MPLMKHLKRYTSKKNFEETFAQETRDTLNESRGEMLWEEQVQRPLTKEEIHGINNIFVENVGRQGIKVQKSVLFRVQGRPSIMIEYLLGEKRKKVSIRKEEDGVWYFKPMKLKYNPKK